MKKHDLARQLEYIQQLLSQNKNPIGFLFGAGCPLSIRVGEGDNAEPGGFNLQVQHPQG